MDIYSTVWLSESIRSVGSKSLNTSASSFTESINMSHSTPQRPIANQTINIPVAREPSKQSKWRTLSLPELEMSTLTGDDLTERFVRLQLEQDNRELRATVDTLQQTLEQVKTSVFPYEAECCDECVDSRNTLDSIFFEHSHKMHRKKQLESHDNVIPSLERTESGYDTLRHDSSLHHLSSFDKHSHESLLFSSTEEQPEEYFQSRLVKRRTGLADHDTSCCMVQ